MADLAPALQQFLDQFRRVSSAIVDSYMIVDADRHIVDFNRAFHAMLPRAVARNLHGKPCAEVLGLNICAQQCIAQQCWASGKQMRLDEISGAPPGHDGEPYRFIVTALPITDEAGTVVGALEIQRNVTDEAAMQGKYQAMLDTEAKARERMAQQLRERTKDLIAANQRLLTTQRELLAIKKGTSV